MKSFLFVHLLIFYTRNTFIATPREGVNDRFRNKLNWNQPIGNKKVTKKNGVKIIIFKAFHLKILFSVRNWCSCIYQEFKDIFKENKQSFEGKSRTLTQFITFKEYTCMADKAFTALYSICRSASFIRLSKRSSVRLRLTVFLAGCYSTTFDAAFSGWQASPILAFI